MGKRRKVAPARAEEPAKRAKLGEEQVETVVKSSLIGREEELRTGISTEALSRVISAMSTPSKQFGFLVCCRWPGPQSRKQSQRLGQ